MRIQGTLEVEGVKLHVNIDAPDNHQEIFVTNVHPNCVVIPRERWKIEYLGFSSLLVDTLHAQGVHFLHHLVDERWEARMDGFTLTEAEMEEIERALETFFSIALVFDQSPEVVVNPELPPGDFQKRLKEVSSAELVSEGQASEVPSVEGVPVKVRANEIMNQDIAVLGLPAGVAKNMRERSEGSVNTIHDVLSAGKYGLRKVRHMNDKMLARIEEGMKKLGLILP